MIFAPAFIYVNDIESVIPMIIVYLVNTGFRTYLCRIFRNLNTIVDFTSNIMYEIYNLTCSNDSD